MVEGAGADNFGGHSNKQKIPNTTGKGQPSSAQQRPGHTHQAKENLLRQRLPPSLQPTRPQKPTDSNNKEPLFLPGDFVKAKFQPDNIIPLGRPALAKGASEVKSSVLSKKHDEDVLDTSTGVPMESVDIDAIIPDEKVKIPMLSSQSYPEGKDRNEEPAGLKANLDSQANDKKEAFSAKIRTTGKLTTPRTHFATGVTTAHPSPSEWSNPRKRPQVTPYPVLKLKEEQLVLGVSSAKQSDVDVSSTTRQLSTSTEPVSKASATTQNRSTVTTKAPVAQIPVLTGGFSAKAPPRNGLENVLQGTKTFQYPSVVIISGKSKTRQQLRENEEDVDPVEAIRRKDEKFYRYGICIFETRSIKYTTVIDRYAIDFLPYLLQ